MGSLFSKAFQDGTLAIGTFESGSRSPNGD